MEITPDSGRDLAILENIEINPDTTQATLANQMGVAVGTVNWHLKRLIAKGYVKVRRAERRKLKYIITAEGLALRARLTVDFIDQQFNLYRRIRSRVSDHLEQVRKAGYQQIRLHGEGDVADICRLTCLEQGFQLVDDPAAPMLEARSMSVVLHIGEQ